jgi:very-short-patch-repair endonuclease
MAHFLHYIDSKSRPKVNSSLARSAYLKTDDGQPIGMQLIRNKNKEADQALTTEAHLLLWRYLRLLELRGVNFIRHALIGGHYVDFLNMEKGVIMEVDAGRNRKTDRLEMARKDRWLAKQGFRVLRFTEEEIAKDMNKVMEKMWESFLDSEEAPRLTEVAASSIKARSQMAEANSLEHIMNCEDEDLTLSGKTPVIAISGRRE